MPEVFPIQLARQAVRLGRRTTEFENIIRESPLAAAIYTRILPDRWYEVEPIIASDPEAALLYMSRFRPVFQQARGWPEAEPALASEPATATVYARDYLRRRWHEVEAMIATDNECRAEYLKHFPNATLPSFEDDEC